MASERRRARMAPAPSSDGVPEWVWGFTAGKWFMAPREEGEVATIQAFVEARRRWREARDAWLTEHGLVMWGMRGLSSSEFQAIEQAEPHRVLRRPTEE